MKPCIAIVGPAHPYRGGNALFVTHLHKALSEDFEVTIVNYSLLYPGFLFPGSTQYDLSHQTHPVPSRRLVNSINPFSWIRTARFLRKLNPHVILFDWWNPFFGPCHFGIAMCLPKRLRKRIVVATENVISHEGRWVDRFLTGFGLRFAAAFLCLSRKVESDLQAIRRSRPVYRSELPVYDVYEQEKTSGKDLQSEWQLPAGKKVILFFGYIRAYKGLDLLIQAMPRVLQAIPECHLLIVGESYEPISTYERLIDTTGIRSSTTLINRFIPNEYVALFYEVADVVVLPYREATQSGILNIAYGCLKPVIVSDVGGLAEFVEEGKTGLIVEPENPDALADAIVRFFGMEVPFAEHIRRRVSENSFGRIAKLFHDICEDLR